MHSSHDLRSKFLLRNDITYLNFGSFGACPKEVFEDYQRWQLELEQEPVQFITVNGFTYLQQSRIALSQYIGCNEKDIVFVTNPSYAVNIIAKSMKLNSNDEIITTDIEYGACDKTWDYYCKKNNAKYVRQPVQFPITTQEQFIEDLFKGVTTKTKMLFISHITSSTGLILPVKEICARAKQLGLLTFVDGAHAPGHIPLDLSQLDVDIYTGACHKWMMTPKGSSFLYIKKEWQYLFDPLVISWGYDSATPSDSQFLDYHQTQGTRDFSAFLTIPKAIAFMEQNDWATVSTHCKQLVLDNAQRFCDLCKSQPIAPIHPNFIGQLFSIPIQTNQPAQLQKHLFDTYKIDIPVMMQNGNTFIRYSIQGFNTQADLDKLYNAIGEIIRTTDLIN